MNIIFDAGNHTNGSLKIRAANYNWSGEHMDYAHFKGMFDLYVNGRKTPFAEDAILPAFEVTKDMIAAAGDIKAADVGYNCFFDINLANINLLNGQNVVELVLNLDNNPAINTWSETADIKMAVSSILMSKTFDNGMICASEQSVIIVDSVYEEVKKEFAYRGAHLMSDKFKVN